MAQMYQVGGHAGINAAGKGGQHLFISYLGPDGGDQFLATDTTSHRHVSRRYHKGILKHFLAVSVWATSGWNCSP
jgi:hypothetical protein